MDCNRCEHTLDRGANFCPQCGADQRADGRRNAGKPHMARHQRRMQYPNDESTASWNEALAKRKHKSNVRGLLCIAVFSTAALGWWLTYGGYLAPGAFFMVGLFCSLIPRSKLSKKEYESIAHAMRADGRGTVCVHCGNPGIYTKGEYKSNSKTHYCSNQACGELLYVS